MEKRRILLAGKNESVIDAIYKFLGDKFEFMCTSLRYDDILSHLKYFEPELFMFCPLGQQGFGESLISVYPELLKKNIMIAVCADSDAIAALSENGRMKVSFSINADEIAMAGTKLIEVFSQLDEDKLRFEVAKKEMAGIATDVQKKHILVIDDDPMMLKLIKEYLHEEYQVATAINGRTAYKFLENKVTDLILLDYEMPGENGPAVLRNLRDNEKTANIPVLFLTGITDRDKIQEILSLKPQGYLLKPIDHDKLTATIVKFI